MITKGRGKKPTYNAEARGRVVQEVQCQTDREKDQMATRSLKLLERALRKVALVLATWDIRSEIAAVK